MFNKNNKNNHRFSAKVLAFIGFIVIIAISYPLSKTINKHYKINKEIKDLEKEIKNMEEKNDSLNKLIKFIGSDEFADKQARLNLNYKKEGEEVVVIKNKEELSGENNNESTHDPDGQKNDSEKEILKYDSNIAKWFEYFIK